MSKQLIVSIDLKDWVEEEDFKHVINVIDNSVFNMKYISSCGEGVKLKSYVERDDITDNIIKELNYE